MSRRYKRDAKGRFASSNAASKAPKRIKFLLTYHGTDAGAAKAIRAGGYQPSKGGEWGPGVYTTNKRRTAVNFARRGGDLFDSPRGPGVVLAHRVSMKTSRIKSQNQGDIVLLDKKTADRTLVKPNSTVRRRRR